MDSPKFKVGDIISRHVENESWYNISIITEVQPKLYTFTILDHSCPQFIKAVQIEPAFFIDKEFQLDLVYTAKKQFDKDLKELLRG